MLDKKELTQLENELSGKSWHLLYLLSSKAIFNVSSEILFESIGKIFVHDFDFEAFHWINVENNNFKPCKSWQFKDKNSKYPIINTINSNELSNPIIQEINALLQKNMNSVCFYTLSNQFAPFKQTLILPINHEQKPFAFLQLFSTEPLQLNADFNNLNYLKLLQLELQRQFERCHVYEKERDQVVQLAQASRLSSLGAMAGGIAHEINNPVTIIMGMLKLVIKELTSDKPINKEKITSTLEKARQYTERISKIVKGIRALSRDGSRDPFILSKVQDIIDNTFGLCEASIQTNSIQLSYDLEDPNLMLECRPVQISQVLLNLINNSLDAIGEQKNPWIHIAVKKINEEIVEFSVTDSGEGIPESIAIQLMQPFFTTKGAGKGTGLGLSISQEIIKAHYGEFALDRNFPNTRFYIQIPIFQNNNMNSRAS